ncbi:non-homologous end-joining DNA ligase LigD [Streptomyces sp. NBC_00690]|uniref:non-homologous end-joining DNA ligase LigD n=1 Tax=Streptomyces sp. NBC_00690 TaxID=2975808 RepID=UPI002E27DC68|nr:hypothetical protein [Streptomyces sp. NBC_00690]
MVRQVVRPSVRVGDQMPSGCLPDHFPDWIHRVELPKENGSVTHAICDDTATLLYLADQACITPHRFLSRSDRPHHPDRFTTALRKDARRGRLYLDIQRNAYAQISFAPYAVRARPGAPVAAPVSWADLDAPGLTARGRTIADIDRILRENPWRNPPRPRSLRRPRRLHSRLAGRSRKARP